MKPIHCLLPLLLTSSLLAATNDLSSALQTGLFEEEANRNLPAAIESYEKVAKQFDQNRALAATAIFRLGEVNRKLGKTNEAATFYQRILREFTDQDTLAKLSQQNLAGMGVRPPADATMADVGRQVIEVEAQIDRDSKTLETLKSLKGSQRLQAIQMAYQDQQLADLMRLFLLAEQRLFATQQKLGAGSPEVKTETALMEDLKKKVDQRADGIMTGFETRLDSMKASVKRLRQYAERSSTTQSVKSSNSPITAVLDEEEAEIRRIQAMIQNSPDLINAPSGENGTPLYQAASKGQLRVTAYLLDHGADVNTRAGVSGKTYGDWTPLFVAANLGHKAMVELLLSRGANIEAKQSAGRTALHAAAEKGFQAVCECLLANKATINTLNTAGQTALHLAVSKGHGAMAEFLLARGVDANVADVNGETALTQAAMAGHADTLRRLVAAGAKIDVEDKVGRTPLSYAAGNGHFDSVTALLAAKADPNAGMVNLPPHCAVMSKSAGIVEALLQAGADANRKSEGYWLINGSMQTFGSAVSPLALAMHTPQLDVIKLLLANKADPNGKRVDGVPLIFSAVGNADMMKAFLDAGAKPNVDDGSGNRRTPLGSASDPKVISLLLAAGADPEVNSPLINAVNGGRLQSAEALLKGGANANAVISWNGKTALHFATEKKNSEMVALLLAHKADVNARDNQGLTPLDYAQGRTDGNTFASGTVHIASAAMPGAPLSYQWSAGQSEKPEKIPIAELLRQHGGLADLPKLDRIEVTRPETGYRSTAFYSGTNGWNQFTLAEVLAQQFGLVSTKRSGYWDSSANNYGNFWVTNSLRFPDLARVKVHSPTKQGGGRTTVNVDLSIQDEAAGGVRDMPLKMGDIVEVPEADHPVNEMWQGMRAADYFALTNSLTRTVKISIGGNPTNLTLAPVWGASGFQRGTRTLPSLMIRSVLDNSGLVRSSSDLTRVKVTRRESANAKPRVWVVDCSNQDNAPDLWLRDGDVIEVPEKSPSIFDTDPTKARAGGKILLSGEVKASVLTLEAGKTTSVLEAVLQAGTTDWANRKKVELQRTDPTTKRVSKVTLNVEAITQGDRSGDMLLQDGDLLIVPKARIQF